MRKPRRAESAILSPILLATIASLAACGDDHDDGSPDELPSTSATKATKATSAASAAPAASAALASPPRYSRAQQLAGVPSRSFVPGELILRTKLEIVVGQTTSIGGVAVTPAERLPSGTWRVLLEDAVAKAPRLARESRAPISDAALASAELATLDALALIAVAADIESAYLNGLLELSGARTLATGRSIDPTLEPFYPYQRWNYEAIRLPQAWQRAPQTSYVRLAIIDSDGANLHPDLVANTTDAASMDPYEPHTYHHGLHVAGIAAASAGNGYGTGVCWQCRFAPYQVGGLSFSQIERAIVYAAGDGNDPPRVHAINLSLNFLTRPGVSEERLSCVDDSEAEGIRLAIARAVSRNVPVIISAGNHNASGPSFPADCPGAISVAAIQPSGAIADYSNRGADVTLAAPGGGGSGNGMYGASLAEMPCLAPFGGDPYSGTVGVAAPWASYEELIPNGKNCYRYLSGTSMAAPHVTGTVGLMKTMHGGLTPAQIRDILVRTARPATACPAGLCGAGLLNADAAVRYASDGGVPLGSLTGHDFGPLAIGQAATGTARITNTGSAPLVTGTTLTIAGSSGQMQFAFQDGTCSAGEVCTRPAISVPPGGSFDIPIRCRPSVGGVTTATLLFYTNRLDVSTGVPDVTLAAQLSCTGYYSNPDQPGPTPEPPPVEQ